MPANKPLTNRSKMKPVYLATLILTAFTAAIFMAATPDPATSGTITLHSNDVAALVNQLVGTVSIKPVEDIPPNFSFVGDSPEPWMTLRALTNSDWVHIYSWTNVEVRVRYRPAIKGPDTNGWWVIRFEDPDAPELIKVPRRQPR